MPKKKFIDKNRSVTFHLVHRSQQDPLVADENAPQRVLLPVENKGKQLEEQKKYGIFFDDDYNYLQHLTECSKVVEWVPVENNSNRKQKSEEPSSSNLALPSSVFASTVEEDVGMLSKAAPKGLQLDVDPDIVAAMDEDFAYDDPENELEDNFMELANAECDDNDDDYDYEDDDEYDASDCSSNFASEEYDDMSPDDHKLFSFSKEETRSRFTDYSMSSSVMHRNDNLTLLDDRFEKMYLNYDDTEIGALDCDEIEGHVTNSSAVLLQCADEFEKQQAREHLSKEETKKLAQQMNGAESSNSETDDDELVEMEVKPKMQWDCESVLSTYSTQYNHPKLICEPKMGRIKLNSRGIPVIASNRLTAKALKELDDATTREHRGAKSVGGRSCVSMLSTISVRPKGETSEERRERKKQLKEYRKERRIEKKATADAFKEETKRQAKIDMNNRNNVQGNRIL